MLLGLTPFMCTASYGEGASKPVSRIETEYDHIKDLRNAMRLGGQVIISADPDLWPPTQTILVETNQGCGAHFEISQPPAEESVIATLGNITVHALDLQDPDALWVGDGSITHDMFDRGREEHPIGLTTYSEMAQEMRQLAETGCQSTLDKTS